MADALSRVPEDHEAVFSGISICQPLVLDQLQSFYASNPNGMALLTKFSNSGTDSSLFTVQQGLLYFQGRLFFPLESGLRPKLIQEYHSTPQGGHSRNKGTLARLTSNFSWPNMAKEVKEFIRTCIGCQQHNNSTHKPYGLLQPLPIP